MSSPFQQAPYLRQQRNFPSDNIQALTVEIDRAYVDIAQKVNTRTISLFALNTTAVTGEQWYLQGQPKPQQTLRKVFTFTSAGSIAHGLSFANIAQFTTGYGSFTDGTNYYGVIYGSNTAIAGQVSFYITGTNIVILSGAGAPTIVSGILVIQWLSKI